MKNPIQTRISLANWGKKGDGVQPAEFPEASGKEIAWLDELLEGGLYFPTQGDRPSSRPLVCLISGPPGSGKTTLAMEMCYRLAADPTGCHSLYVSAEAEAWKLKDKAVRYGWDKSYFYPVPENISHDRVESVIKGDLQEQLVALWGTRDIFENYIHSLHNNPSESLSNIRDNLRRFSRPLLQLLPVFFASDNKDVAKSLIETIIEVIKTPDSEVGTINNDDKILDYADFGIVVIDSLNIIPQETIRSELFGSFLNSISDGPRVVVFVLDSGPPQSGHPFWEHVSDVVIHLDYHFEERSKYLIRSIEIVKARYQTHVWGRHQLKIYPRIDIESPPHPYRNEGGVFIYPSIHWFLSRYKSRAPERQSTPAQTPLDALNRILGEVPDANMGGGLPRGRCTAMVGARGAHKSHLGYYHILNSIGRNSRRPRLRERGLIISLRDDVGLAVDAMTSLLATSAMNGTSECIGKPDKAEKILQEYINFNDLEILYYPPGYITPEEFYHRTLMSLLRLKKSESEEEHVHITVLFNSLDQLSARFPLCAKEDVFIPGLIDTFTAEGVTSIFIAVDEPGQPEHQYGLLTMADLILSFQQRFFEANDYFGHLLAEANRNFPAEKGGEGKGLLDEAIRAELGEEIQAVVLRVERFAGGQRAGEGGILELVQKKPLEALYDCLFDRPSRLEFIPFSPSFAQGSPIQNRSN